MVRSALLASATLAFASSIAVAGELKIHSMGDGLIASDEMTISHPHAANPNPPLLLDNGHDRLPRVRTADTISKNPLASYLAWAGGAICGSNVCGSTIQWGMAFSTPATTTKVTKVILSVGALAGAGNFDVSLWDDVNIGGQDYPNNQLFVLPNQLPPVNFGSCCDLVGFRVDWPVMANSVYWVVLSPSNANVKSGWNNQVADQLNCVNAAVNLNQGAGWQAGCTIQEFGYDIFGH